MMATISEDAKCPICFEIPAGEIYQCKNGHSVCATCCFNMQQCPVCRALYTDGRIRNRTLETVLDNMDVEINCPNMILGCKQKIVRKQAQAHASVCIFNPNCVRFCEQLGYKCDFRVDTASTKNAVKHLQDKHGFLLREGKNAVMQLAFFKSTVAVPSGESKRVDGGSKSKKMWTPLILDLERSYKKDKNGPTFILLAYFHPEDKSLACVGVHMSGSIRGIETKKKYHAKFMIKTQTKKKGIKPLEWTIPVISMIDFKEAMEIVPFRIPVSLLLQHYTNRTGNLPVLVNISQHYVEGDLELEGLLLELTSPNSTFLVPITIEGVETEMPRLTLCSINAPQPCSSSGGRLPSLLSASNGAMSGTIGTPYQAPTLAEGGGETERLSRIQCITSMAAYLGKSLEELRLEDYFLYSQGRWTPAPTPAAPRP